MNKLFTLSEGFMVLYSMAARTIWCDFTYSLDWKLASEISGCTWQNTLFSIFTHIKHKTFFLIHHLKNVERGSPYHCTLVKIGIFLKTVQEGSTCMEVSLCSGKFGMWICDALQSLSSAVFIWIGNLIDLTFTVRIKQHPTVMYTLPVCDCILHFFFF